LQQENRFRHPGASLAVFGDPGISLILEVDWRLHGPHLKRRERSEAGMQSASISTIVESLREEIQLIQNQERFYRSKRHHSDEEIAAHSRRELRLLDIRPNSTSWEEAAPVRKAAACNCHPLRNRANTFDIGTSALSPWREVFIEASISRSV